MDHTKTINYSLLKIELFTFVYAQIRAYIILSRPYSLKEILNDFVSHKQLPQKDYPYKKLKNILTNYETQLNVKRPCVESLEVE